MLKPTRHWLAGIIDRGLAILLQRCPRCFKGSVFHGLWSMYRRCPVCDLDYEREEGYFLGAMYFSYGMAVLAVLPVCLVMIEHDASLPAIGVVMAAELTLLSPVLFRYSRVLWLHFDQCFNTR